MKEFLQEYVFENPFMLDFRRLMIKGGGRSAPTSTKIFLILGACVFLLFLMINLRFPSEIPPEAVFSIHIVIMMLLATLSSYSSYASEIERRTWDFVLVSPISVKKIVIGKAITGMGTILIFHALMILIELAHLVIVVTVGVYKIEPIQYLFANVFILVVGTFLVALTSLISSRCNRVKNASTLAFLATFGLLFIGAIVGSIIPETQQALSLTNPIIPVMNAFQNGKIWWEQPLLQIPIYIFLAFCCVLMLSNNVRRTKA